jgi:hypothetical protein
MSERCEGGEDNLRRDVLCADGHSRSLWIIPGYDRVREILGIVQQQGFQLDVYQGLSEDHKPAKWVLWKQGTVRRTKPYRKTGNSLRARKK